jgi:putative nucleotidyltransferase with HDIG domain
MQKEKALIVDDDPIIREVLSDILSGICGFETDTAVDGLDGLNKLRNNPYDIVFTDLSMPHLGGIDLLKESVKEYPSIPVVMITGISTVDTAVNAMREGAKDFIIKPFQIEKVISVAERVIGEKKLLKQMASDVSKEESIQRINAELFKKLQEISILHSLTLELDGIYNNKELYEKIVEMAAKLLAVKHSFFALVEGNRLKIIHSTGLGSLELKIRGSILEDVIKCKSYSIIFSRGADLFKGLSPHSEILLIPFTLKDEVFAILGLYDKADNSAFTEEEIAIILTFAKKASLRIENNALYEVFYNNLINTLKSLVISIEARDSYTKQHSERVAIYSLQIADVIGLRDDDKDAIRFGGYLHDIGKMGVRDTILLKPSKLTPKEMAEIKLHPLKGDEIIKPIRFFPKERELVRYHHERFDGSGYPDGLAGYEIPLVARILSVADAYDAMTTSRPYRDAIEHSLTLKELKRCMGTQFDQEIVRAFLQTPAGKGRNNGH